MKINRSQWHYKCISLEGDKSQKEVAEECIQDIENKQKPRKTELNIFRMGLKPENKWFEHFVLFKQQNIDKKNHSLVKSKDIDRKKISQPQNSTENKNEVWLDSKKLIQNPIKNQYGEKVIYTNYIEDGSQMGQ